MNPGMVFIAQDTDFVHLRGELALIMHYLSNILRIL